MGSFFKNFNPCRSIALEHFALIPSKFNWTYPNGHNCDRNPDRHNSVTTLSLSIHNQLLLEW
jgi:hypothetical protein